MPTANRETMTYRTDRIETLLDEGVHNKVYPGAVWAVGDAFGIHAHGTTGVLDPDEPHAPMRPDTVFDAASLTKILAVWSSVGALWEEGKLDLDAPLGEFWPEVGGHPLAVVTARQLLTHTAGVPLRAQLKNLYGTDPQDIRDGVLHEALHRPPGEAVEYTDRAALILGYLAEHLSGGAVVDDALDPVDILDGLDTTLEEPEERLLAPLVRRVLAPPEGDVRRGACEALPLPGSQPREDRDPGDLLRRHHGRHPLLRTIVRRTAATVLPRLRSSLTVLRPRSPRPSR